MFPSKDLRTRGGACLVLLAAVTSAVACDAVTEPRSAPARLWVLPLEPTVIPGEPIQLIVELDDEAGRRLPTPAVTWTVADPSIALVDASGLLTGLQQGTTTVSATAGELTTTVTVRVQPARTFLAPMHTCALTAERVAHCWGRNDSGQLGVGDRTTRTTPTPVPLPVEGWMSISTGSAHTCGVQAPPGHPVWCWGASNRGQTGNGGFEDRLQPTRIADDLNRAGTSAGGQHTCSTRVDFQLDCWGAGDYGQLGRTGTDIPTPVLVSGLLARVVTSGAEHSCAREDGSDIAWCWGRNNAGQLGLGDRADRSAPTSLGMTHRFVRLSAGGLHTCGVRADGVAECWGSNHAGQLGIARTVRDRLVPTEVTGSQVWSSISAGGAHTCALTTEGIAWCWGSNSRGQLGSGSLQPSNEPATVATGLTFVAIRAGHDFTCALTAAGVVHCWGANDFGQLGTGDFAPRLVPAAVPTTAVFSSLGDD